MAGAAYLSAKAAYRTGAGMVKVLTAEENRNIIQTLLPEALFASYDNDYDQVLSAIDWADVLVIGPGLGLGDKSRNLLSFVINVINKNKKPVVADADAINILAEEFKRDNLSVKERIDKLENMLPEGSVLTPHPLELSRLLGIPAADVTDNVIDIVNQCFYNSKLIYVLKSARTIVTGPGMKYINVSGNNGMATAGSGDVLTGIIAALLAQGLGSYDAACLAVYIHGLAGDAAAEKLGVYSMTAGDIADSISDVLKE